MSLWLIHWLRLCFSKFYSSWCCHSCANGSLLMSVVPPTQLLQLLQLLEEHKDIKQDTCCAIATCSCCKSSTESTSVNMSMIVADRVQDHRGSGTQFGMWTKSLQPGSTSVETVDSQSQLTTYGHLVRATWCDFWAHWVPLQQHCRKRRGKVFFARMCLGWTADIESTWHV